MDIFVTGGTGYVGVPIVQQLLSDGHRVRVLTRNATHALFNGSDQIFPVEGDLFDNASLQLGLHGADAVIHLVGIIRENTRQRVTMERIHVEGTERIIAATVKAGVKRYLHMSALGSRSDAVSGYHKSKWAAEKRVRQSGLDFTIFRPSVVFGHGGPGPNFVQQVARAMRQLPFIPMLGNGMFLLQPVHTSTVAQVFSQALDKPETCGETFDVGGPTVLEYRDIVRQLAAVLDLKKPTLNIPLVAVENLVRLIGWTGQFPLTRDQLIMLKEGNVCTNSNKLREVFQFEEVPFSVMISDVKS